MTTTLSSAISPDFLNSELRCYRNKNTGTWLFGFVTDKKSPRGLRALWTQDEALALADCGEVAKMLGLGSDAMVAASMSTSAGVQGAALTRWDSILDQRLGGGESVACLCKRGATAVGGKQLFLRNDGKELICRQ